MRKGRNEEVLGAFLMSVREEIKEYFNIQLEFNQFLIKTSHGVTVKKKGVIGRKYSWHILVPSLCFNSPTVDLPAFNLLVQKRLKKNLDLNDDWKTFPDPSVYKSTQLFRLSESTKDFDYYRPAKLLKEFVINGEKIKFQWELEGSFVGLYTGDKQNATLLPSFDTKIEKIIEPKELNELQLKNHNCTVERFNCSLEDIERILNNIGNDGNGVHFDIYLKIGMGLHHFFEGEVEGLKLWKNWCKRSAKYNEAQT